MKNNPITHIAFFAIVALLTSGAFAQSSSKDIVDTAVESGKFKTLVTAVTKAELVDTLKGKGPFTVFAPTDEAFKKVPAEVLQSLLKPENKEKLQSILKFHVVAGKVMAADVVKLSKAKTVLGQEVKIETKGSDVMINGAKVLKTDIVCKNGVIHVIDAVILPSAGGSASKGSGDKGSSKK